MRAKLPSRFRLVRPSCFRATARRSWRQALREVLLPSLSMVAAQDELLATDLTHSTLTDSIPATEHDKSRRKIKSRFIAESPKARKFYKIEFHLAHPSKRTTSAGETASSRTTTIAVEAIAAIRFF